MCKLNKFEWIFFPLIDAKSKWQRKPILRNLNNANVNLLKMSPLNHNRIVQRKRQFQHLRDRQILQNTSRENIFAKTMLIQKCNTHRFMLASVFVFNSKLCARSNGVLFSPNFYFSTVLNSNKIRHLLSQKTKFRFVRAQHATECKATSIDLFNETHQTWPPLSHTHSNAHPYTRPIRVERNTTRTHTHTDSYATLLLIIVPSDWAQCEYQNGMRRARI